MRYTAKMLSDYIKDINKQMIRKGFNHVFETNVASCGEGHRVDHIIVDNMGRRRNLTTLEVGSPRDCRFAIDTFLNGINDRELIPKRPTRLMVKTLLIKYWCLGFKSESCCLRNDELCTLSKWAKATKYRKSPTSSHSLGSAFYVHLQTRVSV